MQIKIGAVNIKDLEITKIVEFPANGQFKIEVAKDDAVGEILLTIYESSMIRNRKI